MSTKNLSRFPMAYNKFPVDNLKRLCEELNQSNVESITVIVKEKGSEWPDLYAYGETATNNALLVGTLEYAKLIFTSCRTQIDDPYHNDE